MFLLHIRVAHIRLTAQFAICKNKIAGDQRGERTFDEEVQFRLFQVLQDRRARLEVRLVEAHAAIDAQFQDVQDVPVHHPQNGTSEGDHLPGIRPVREGKN